MVGSRPRPKVFYHGRTTHPDGQHTVTLSIRGTRYDYHLSPPAADTVEFLCRNVSALKALNFAKSRAHRIVRT